MGRIVMGYWDCPVCGSKGIAGNVMNCPACGRARGDVKFYMKGVAEGAAREEGDTADIEYLDEQQAKDFGDSPDWYCSFCNSLNRDRAAFCSNCGASRESSESNYFDQLKKREEREKAEKAAQPRPGARTKPAKKSRSPLAAVLIIALVIIGIVTFLNGKTTTGNLLVTDISWTRSIPVEKYQEFREEGWSVPAGGTEISRSQKIHHYDQVLSHYEDVTVQRSRQVLDHYETYYTYTDRGNGSFEQVEHRRPVYKTEYYTETESRPVYRSVPRMATYYVYTIWRWKQSRTATASGADHSPAWPDTNLGENEREGSPRAEEYTFTVQDGKEAKSTWRIAEADWEHISAGDRISITARRSGADAWVTDEKGNQLYQITRK